jgi:hypothetical protein
MKLVNIEEYYLLGYNAVWSIKGKRRFVGTYCFHLQRRRISRAGTQHENRWQAINIGCII